MRQPIVETYYGQRNDDLLWLEVLWFTMVRGTVTYYGQRNYYLLWSEELWFTMVKGTMTYYGQRNCDLLWSEELWLTMVRGTMIYYGQRNYDLLWSEELWLTMIIIMTTQIVYCFTKLQVHSCSRTFFSNSNLKIHNNLYFVICVSVLLSVDEEKPRFLLNDL